MHSGSPPRRAALVVDDNDAIRSIIVGTLEPHYAVTAAATAADALRESDSIDPGDLAVVVVDINLPDASGPVVVDKIRAKHPTVKAVFISGGSPDELWFDANHATFVQKPFRRDELLASVEHILRSVVTPSGET
jgi:two-component system cell cycle sensor histidine kinase/response regulator CckA